MKKSLTLLMLLYLLCSVCFAQKNVKGKKSKVSITKKIKADWRVLIIPAPKSVDSKVGYVEIFPHANDLDFAHFAVTTARGDRVKAQLLWSAEGEAMKILFDASSKSKYYSVLFGKTIPRQKVKWEPKVGLILETRKRASGNANNWKEAKEVFDHSQPIEGRSLVKQIFHGINPHGLSIDLAVHFKGYIKVNKTGGYRFAIAADDAVFLFIDGKKVTDWPGWHGPWDGVKGKFSGKVHLKKGVHSLDYYNIQNGYGMNMVCGWQPPGQKYLKVISPEAFVPVQNYQIKKLKYKNKDVADWFQWKSDSHLIVNGKAIVKMDFKAINPPKGTECKWFFDDLQSAAGANISHLFFSPGLRKVKLEIKKKGKVIDTVESVVKVAPRWAQREEWPISLQKKLKKKVNNFDYSKLPKQDLINWVNILDIIENRKLLAKVGKTCLKRKKDFADTPQLFYKLSQCYIHYSIREYDLAEKAYLAILDYAKDPHLVAKAKLYLGALKIHNYGKCDEGIKLLNEIDDKQLAAFEKRKKLIWLADGFMTQGDMENVDKIYAKLPDVVDKKKNSNTIMNEARVLNALDYLRRDSYDDAEKMVWQVEWEYPHEAMKSSTGLVMTKIFIKRKEYNYALWRCMRMMNAAQNSRQMSEIMLTLIEVYLLTGNKKEAVALSDKLLKEFPYSEAAAILKEKSL